jgi:hypothetical protein
MGTVRAAEAWSNTIFGARSSSVCLDYIWWNVQIVKIFTIQFSILLLVSRTSVQIRKFSSAPHFIQTHSLKFYCEPGIVRYTFRFALRVSQRCELQLNSSDTFLASTQIRRQQFQRYTYMDNIGTDRMSRSLEWYLYFVFGSSQVQTRPSQWLSLLRYGLRFLQFLRANSGIRLSYTCTGLDRPWGLQEVEAPRSSRQSAHEGYNNWSVVARLSTLRTGGLYSQEIFPGTHFC